MAFSIRALSNSKLTCLFSEHACSFSNLILGFLFSYGYRNINFNLPHAMLAESWNGLIHCTCLISKEKLVLGLYVMETIMFANLALSYCSPLAGSIRSVKNLSRLFQPGGISILSMKIKLT